MHGRRWPKTDFGTVFLHWSCVASLAVLSLTGLRIAADEIGLERLRVLDPYLPVQVLWFNHLVAGYAMTAVVVAYVIYVANARLCSRIRLDRSRLSGVLGSSRMRWSSLNVLFYWCLFAALGASVLSGWLAYFGYGEPVLTIHLACLWVMLAFPLVHVLAMVRLGGVRQLVRIFRPTIVIPSDRPLDLASVVADLLAEQSASSGAGRKRMPIRRAGGSV